MTDKVETSLSVDYAYIKRRVARVLAYPEETEWTETQHKAVDACINDGLRQYYQPPEVDQFGAHQWSFMYPTLSMKTKDGTRWYPMPDGFAGELTKAGGLTYSGDSTTYGPIQVTSEPHLRRLSSLNAAQTGYPVYVAPRPKSDRGLTEQEWQMGFHPIPDGEYDIEYSCYMKPYMLTDTRPYPLGGQAHAQGILYSCLSAAEMYEFDQHGVHYDAFIKQLTADISHDARKAPATVGYSDKSDRRHSRYRGRNSVCLSNSLVTYNGQIWGG